MKNIPAAVNKRLSSISANEAVFNAATPLHQEALVKSGYSHQLKFEPQLIEPPKKRKRGRKITWFNPPYSANVYTHIGAKFLKIIDKCFPPNHPLRKIINRNTVKISYRCMPNMNQMLAKHNHKITKMQDKTPPPPCNCVNGPDSCPVGKACQTTSVVYGASVVREDNNTSETYTGLTSRRFKDRLYEHNSDINNESREGTGLSHHVWRLKNSNTPYTISWEILSKCPSFNPSNRTCRLCLQEKFHIMFHPEGATLNSRSEFYSTCRHRLKPLLGNT